MSVVESSGVFSAVAEGSADEERREAFARIEERLEGACR